MATAGSSNAIVHAAHNPSVHDSTTRNVIRIPAAVLSRRGNRCTPARPIRSTVRAIGPFCSVAWMTVNTASASTISANRAPSAMSTSLPDLG